ncbi:aspartyl-phosphate phosphatase Spo0E family protein [Cohnella terricola]|uniref:Aspartyl-phosphate phosphatase Spo0E family protein n=1 Tax=Cohnella terricola TaxID=1289167 RepID=A0A559JFV0_9BACL|nr:aspartyl-phosphate phosphatase Spo0E family protein [Cohnella terricola]TVX98748.1 aspartyl-phosphate phosphatase Spo0E family protein [Cohnella terricola]
MGYGPSKLTEIKARIECLRQEMNRTFVVNGGDPGNLQVLKLSQLLDEQLNCYEGCKQYEAVIV